MKLFCAILLAAGLVTARAQLIPDPSNAARTSSTNYTTLDLVSANTNFSAQAFTEFYATGTGNNLNSGHTTDDAATFTATGGFWTNATGVFTKTALAPVAGGVTNGAWASVYPDGTTTNVFIGRVISVSDVSNTIVVSSVAKTGTKPANDTTGATTIRVGGAWKGPATNGVNTYDQQFPFNGVQATMTNSSGNATRINFKNAQPYFVTNNITHNQAGPIQFQGYTTTPGDGGKAIIDGSWAAASFVLFSPNTVNITFDSLIFRTNGPTAGNYLVQTSGSGRMLFSRCVFIGAGATGLNLLIGLAVDCEAYNCNRNNTASAGGFQTGTRAALIRCVSHDHIGANSVGFVNLGESYYLHCLAYNCGRTGIYDNSDIGISVFSSDCYSNAGSGIEINNTTSQSYLYVENSNLFKNRTNGINAFGLIPHNGLIQNCVFGSGTQTNLQGNIGTNILGGLLGNLGIDVRFPVVYTNDLTPWVDPTNGNFTIKSTAGTRSLGRGFFTQSLLNSPTNTVGYPDVGAAQGSDTNAIIVQ